MPIGSPSLLRTACVAGLFAISAQSAFGDEPPHDGKAAIAADADGDGKTLYLEHCASCHKPDGSGYITVIPPLAGSDYFAADAQRLLAATVDGLSGPVTVNGISYVGVMPAMNHLSDLELATILNYVQQQWGSAPDRFTDADIGNYRKAARKDKKRPADE